MTVGLVPFRGVTGCGSSDHVAITRRSSHVVHLDFGAFSSARRTVLVEPSLFAVHPTVAGLSFEVFRTLSGTASLQAAVLFSSPILGCHSRV